MYEIFSALLEEKGLKAADVTRATGIKSPVFSEWKKGKSKPNTEKMIKIANFLGVSVEYLMTGIEPEEKQSTIELTKRDQRDIKKSVDEIMTSLDNHDGETLYYDGVEVDLSDETKALLRNALTLAMQAVKMENKEKYNPHKNGK